MRILLVDDDTSVLQALLAILKTIPGHEVRVAANGGKALEIAATQNGTDLLITDVSMEEIDGFSLSEMLGAHYPEMRTIFISGFDLSDYGDRIGTRQLLEKPISAERLIAAVEQETAPRSPRVAPIAAARAAAPVASAVPAAQAVTIAHSVPGGRAIPVAQAAPVARAMPVAQAAPPEVPSPPAPPVQPKRAVAAPAGRVPESAPRSPVPPPVTRIATQSLSLASAGITHPHSTSAGLFGQAIGGYQIVSQLGESRWGTVYAAVQTAINRPVGLKVFDPVRARDESQRQRFIADARAKAHVQHPSILSVYEAGAAEGWIFYTHEYVDGKNLSEMAEVGDCIDELSALKILRVAAEGLLYLSRNDLPHSTLSPSDIYLGADGHPRLANLATHTPDHQLTIEQEIEVLGEAIWAVIPGNPPVSDGLRTLLARTQQTSPSAITAWGALLQGIKALEPKIIPLEAEKISAQERAAAAAAEKARAAQRRAFYLNVGSMAALVTLAAWAVWHYVFRSNERVLDDMIHIPAGQFVFGDGGKGSTGEYWIDKYEVTIGQYSKFVDWIRENPSDEKAFDHPRQPKQLSHIPEAWNIYYGQARAGKAAHSTPISLNSPMLMATWWDAYAYARWHSRDLPTEQEWEKAARGTEGRIYPWGAAAEPKRANTNADYQPRKPGAKGTVDGYNLWGDVDDQNSDKSIYGVVGMAGNVSEWTLTWTPDNSKPILKGGNFSAPLTTLNESTPMDASTAAEYIGFRTVSHKAPGK